MLVEYEVALNRARLEAEGAHQAEGYIFPVLLGSLDVVNGTLTKFRDFDRKLYSPSIAALDRSPVSLAPVTLPTRFPVTFDTLHEGTSFAVGDDPPLAVDWGARSSPLLHDILDIEFTEVPPVMQTRDVLDMAWSDLERLYPAIGEGATASVYSGTWRGNVVAIKVLKSIVKGDISKTAERELKMLLELRHPRILTLIGLCTHVPAREGSLALVTELMARGSLYDILQPRGRQRPDL